ncbi:DNA-directed primase/polymerase protein [Fundulus heteroclitus]|uniref:DNA-directed primase/polymerase protein n=1 Tax=Fundulus heteroclitus TaxID=8078 RepID=UPI00165B4CC2|nr:DNA-directed primase/polymerase protein [Fundulus heteroclitus]XP_035992898.1 DNA-directed primase/polymerase protein [Fundulus heteroclitus]XP_035992899.1 DNA-directed primase/polymerase protein [Fundulus heteroclitus]XP_035992900.1 DNA-directed primase/polymerase protein [Fundulus heteroclitus]
MSSWGDRLKKVEQLAQSFQQNPLTTPYKPRLWPCQPSSVWKLFPRQSLAISFAQSCREAVHVFALEKEKAPLGQRIYLVTSYSELWHYYRAYPQSLMHCYELIPEGAVCKLYFDLEFHKPSNEGSDGKSMVSLLIQYVCAKLREVYGIECSVKNVLNLDSSTDEKFSRHLIFMLQNAAFKDNIHVGRFIHHILQPIITKLRSESRLHKGDIPQSDSDRQVHVVSEAAQSPLTKRRKEEVSDLGFLLVTNKDGHNGLFVDLGVYTRNRNFRLYKSSKVGKNAAFTVAEDNQFAAKPAKGASVEESVFLASLVCNISFTGQRILTWDGTENKEAKTPTPQCQQGSDSNPGTFSGCLSSPYQEVDNFVLTLVRKDGVQGSIRRWSYFAADQLLVYDIANYRWCENVGRFHKSNNVMIVVDLKVEVWYQKCHDPDCRNFRSSSFPLPQEICVSYILSLDEEDQAYLMDDTGNFEPSQASSCPAEEAPEVWGDEQDEREYLKSLDDFEENNAEISDQLLLTCVADLDS